MLRRITTIALSIIMTLTMIMPVAALEGMGDLCPNCGLSDWTEWDGIDPSCGYSGYESRRCNNCYEWQDRDIPATGKHTWSSWTRWSNPTCGEAGEEYRCCEVCFDYQVRDIPATGKHDWEEWDIVTAATINKTGLKELYCWDCGATKTVKIAKLKPFVKFAKKTYSVNRGKTMTLKANFAKGDKIKSWKSSKKSVATINKNGKIVAKKIGTTKITVTTKSGKKATCTVKVVKPSKAKKTGGKVYWTPYGGVYHLSKSCRTLKRSKVIKSGTIKQSGKPRVCKVCGH